MCFHIFSGCIQNNPVGCIDSSSTLWLAAKSIIVLVIGNPMSRQSSAHVASLCPTDASLMWGL